MTLIKWYGSKRRIAGQILDIVEEEVGKPITADLFFGSGAVTFEQLRRDPSHVMSASDMNDELVHFWHTMTGHVNREIFAIEVDALARRYQEERDAFYKELVNSLNFPYEVYGGLYRAARFYALNKLSFNGLWRTNKLGIYNTPCGHPKHLSKLKSNDLEEIGTLLSRLYLTKQSYLVKLREADKDDVLYLDPPYMPRTKAKGVEYGCGSFDFPEFFEALDVSSATLIVSHCEHSTFDWWMRSGARKYRRVEIEHQYCASSTNTHREKVKEILYVSVGR